MGGCISNLESGPARWSLILVLLLASVWGSVYGVRFAGRILVTQWCRPSRESASSAWLGIVQLFGGSGCFVVFRVPHQVPAGVCVAWGGLSHACSFVSARARESVLGQATWRSLLEAVHLAGVACAAKKNGRSIYHGTCAAHFHSSSEVLVEWAMGMWWRGVVLGG